jgi:formamidopyrimidine-DNA glycosylase
MPELPEVETLSRHLDTQLKARSIDRVWVRQPKLRWDVDIEALKSLCQNSCIQRVRRRAKYLLFDVGGGRQAQGIMMIHLGMSGSLSLGDNGRPQLKHEHVGWRFVDGEEMRFRDARRFGMVDCLTQEQEHTHPRLAHLGVEPLLPYLGSRDFYHQTRGLKISVKNFLMDARRLVGVGNIYASEALHMAGVNPIVAVGRLSFKRWQKIVAAVQTVLLESIEHGGTTIRDFRHIQGGKGLYVNKLQVYGREGEACYRCSTLIRRRVLSGRSTFDCPLCQRV